MTSLTYRVDKIYLSMKSGLYFSNIFALRYPTKTYYFGPVLAARGGGAIAPPPSDAHGTLDAKTDLNTDKFDNGIPDCISK